MNVIVFVKATKESEAGEMPSQELLEAMGKYNEELINAGIMKAGEGLKPTSAAKRITFRGSDRIVTDGPFAETKELVAGYWLWEVDSMEQAVEWVKKCPNPMKDESDIEIRPIYEMEDFAESDPDGTVMAHEECLRKKLADRENQTAMNPVGWFEIYVQDMARAANFYESVLDIKLEDLPSPLEEIELMAFPMSMQSSGAAGALTKMDGVASGGNSTLVYFTCQDCAIEGSRVEASGGRIQRPKTSLGPYGFMVLAVDTEGNMFGLHSQK